MLNVHVRINDSRTGKPTPARLRITDADGNYRPPLGRLARFRTGPGEDVGGQVVLDGAAWAYVDGACEIPLPAGMLTVEITKGPEYVAVRRQVSLTPGQMAIRFALDRWTDERAVGWFAGDVRACDLTPHAALLEGAAEGLAVVQLLARECPETEGMSGSVSNLLAFSGDRAALCSPECLVAVNTLNAHAVLGSVSLLNCHRPVFPLRFGKPGESDRWSVADWCDQCHRKKGLVVWPDLPRLTEDHPQGEALAALVLGKIDAFEIGPGVGFESNSFPLYYRLLGYGFRPALVGGSGKDSNAMPLGALRTYANLRPGEAMDAGTWIEAVRRGRTYLTSGPLLSFTVKGAVPGSVLQLLTGQEARFRAEARSALALDSLEVIANGNVIASATPASDGKSIVVDSAIACENTTWLAARCRGQGRLPGGISSLAHTSPVFVMVEGKPLPARDENQAPLLKILGRTLDWLENEADCPTARQRQHLREVLDSARMRLQMKGG